MRGSVVPRGVWPETDEVKDRQAQASLGGLGPQVYGTPSTVRCSSVHPTSVLILGEDLWYPTPWVVKCTAAR